MAPIQQESVARPEGRKKEGLTFSLGEKLKAFLTESTDAAKTEIQKTNEDLMIDGDLGETEKDSLRSVAEMAAEQLKVVSHYVELADRLQAMREGEEKGGPEALRLLESQVDAIWMQLEGEPAPAEVFLAAVKDREAAKKNKPVLEVRAEPPTAAALGDEKKEKEEEQGDTNKGEAPVDWGSRLVEEQGRRDGFLDMMKGTQATLESFQAAHADSPGLTPTEQQYLWALETEIGWQKANGEVVENTLAGIAAQKTLLDLPPTPDNAEAVQLAQAALEQALERKPVLEAALATAALAMHEARASYTQRLKEAGVEVEEETGEGTTEAEPEGEIDWTSGRALGANESSGGFGGDAGRTASGSSEVITLNGAGHAENKAEEGFLRQTWKGLSGWLKSLFG